MRRPIIVRIVKYSRYNKPINSRTIGIRFELKDINFSMANGVIAYDKSSKAGEH